mmetsp:Transcript_34765/g.40255  ORF Transcript_34765/g.40255 Transcript_34765/m.40255 type:complete len:161 (-) Transcript_34765:52-534(-)
MRALQTISYWKICVFSRVKVLEEEKRSCVFWLNQSKKKLPDTPTQHNRFFSIVFLFIFTALLEKEIVYFGFVSPFVSVFCFGGNFGGETPIRTEQLFCACAHVWEHAFLRPLFINSPFSSIVIFTALCFFQPKGFCLLFTLLGNSMRGQTSPFPLLDNVG